MPTSHPTPGGRPGWIPNTNVFISPADELVLQFEISSMRSENLEITVEGRRLRVSGNRCNAAFEAAKTVLVHEIHRGPFESIIDVPAGYDPERAKANYLNGMLSITIPKEDSPLLPTLRSGKHAELLPQT